MRTELQGEDPLEIWRQWLQAAEQSEPNDPIAAALATASPQGAPSVRMVLVKRSDAAGFCFFTNVDSMKGRELTVNPQAALCFHWKSLRRQVRLVGPVELLDEKTTDEYFHSRSRGSQIAAQASHQGSPLQAREQLQHRFEELTQQFDGLQIPRPTYWQGYRLIPESIEFWMDGENRLHDRRTFLRDGTGWKSLLLAP